MTTRILLIEDDQELSELLSEFLALENFEIDQAFFQAHYHYKIV